MTLDTTAFKDLIPDTDILIRTLEGQILVAYTVIVTIVIVVVCI